MSSETKDGGSTDIWDYLRARASLTNPDSLTFFDTHDNVLYRDVDLQEIGKHGWEMVAVHTVTPDRATTVYEYFFKRNRAKGYSAGFGVQRAN